VNHSTIYDENPDLHHGLLGAINESLNTLFGKSASSFGYVDLHTALSAGVSVTVTASGVPAGTALYAVLLNSSGKIIFIHSQF